MATMTAHETWQSWCRRMGVECSLQDPNTLDVEKCTLHDAVMLTDMHRAWRTGIDPLMYRASLASELIEVLEADD